MFSRETGQSVSFNCTADGIPVPVIAWRRNGQLLLPSARYSEVITDPSPGFRSEDQPGVLKVTSNLTVTSLKTTDQGAYSCRADNGEGDGAVMGEPYQLTVTERELVDSYFYYTLLDSPSSLCTGCIPKLYSPQPQNLILVRLPPVNMKALASRPMTMMRVTFVAVQMHILEAAVNNVSF